MKPIVFIGDLHGQINLVRKIKEQFPNHRRIWLGDIPDSYDQSTGNMLACIYETMDEEKVMGNHDFHYFCDRGRCSGYNNILQSLIIPIRWKWEESFKHHIYIPEANLLVTHAGICNRLYNELVARFQVVEWGNPTIETELKEFQSLKVGKFRGGINEYGGHLWCDWNKEFDPVPGLNQVFGHTPVEEIECVETEDSTNYNLDCLERGKQEVLVWNNGVFVKESIR